jgi:hypothetical protein
MSKIVFSRHQDQKSPSWKHVSKCWNCFCTTSSLIHRAQHMTKKMTQQDTWTNKGHMRHHQNPLSYLSYTLCISIKFWSHGFYCGRINVVTLFLTPRSCPSHCFWPPGGDVDSTRIKSMTNTRDGLVQKFRNSLFSRHHSNNSNLRSWPRQLVCRCAHFSHWP